MTDRLNGKVALVAGATRGAGRAIAVELAPSRRHGVRHRPQHALGALGVQPAGDDRGDGRADRGRRRRGRRPQGRPPRADQVAALVERIDSDHGRLDMLVNDIWGGELLFDWNAKLWEHDLDDGLRLLRLAVETHLITSHHALPLLIRRPGRPGGGDDRRHRRVQRRQLPRVRVLRPGQDRGAAPGLEPGTRAGRVRLHRGGAHAGLDALGDDAREPRRDRGQLERRASPATSASRRHPPSPGGRWPPSPPTPTSPGGTRPRSPRGSSRGSTGSPTSTAARRTAGATWSRFRTRASRRTPPDTASTRHPAPRNTVISRMCRLSRGRSLAWPTTKEGK